MRALPGAVLALLACAAAAPRAQDGTAAVFAGELRRVTEARLAAAVAGLDGVVGYVAADLAGGDRFARLDDTPFPAASTIKLAILYELIRQADEGRLALSESAKLDRSRAVPGGLFHELGTPVLSLKDHAVAMILQSDNTATNVLIARLGMDAVNARMASLGLAGTKLRRYMIDHEAARRGDENVTSPADLARVLTAFHRGEGLSEGGAATALEILRRPKGGPISQGVPAGVPLASKTGALEGVRADAAIVGLDGRPFVVVVMTTFLQDEEAGSRAITEIARAAWDHFSRRHTLSEYGRRVR